MSDEILNPRNAVFIMFIIICFMAVIGAVSFIQTIILAFITVGMIGYFNDGFALVKPQIDNKYMHNDGSTTYSDDPTTYSDDPTTYSDNPTTYNNTASLQVDTSKDADDNHVDATKEHIKIVPSLYDDKFINNYGSKNHLSQASYNEMNKTDSTYYFQHGTQERYPVDSWFRSNYGLDRTAAITPERYTSCYTGPLERNLGLGRTVDDEVARQSTWRNNEKKVLDGYVSKNANYYRRNYSDELEEYEAKPWWGEDEF